MLLKPIEPVALFIADDDVSGLQLDSTRSSSFRSLNGTRLDFRALLERSLWGSKSVICIKVEQLPPLPTTLGKGPR